jgi:transcription antitermination factor NusG
MLLPVEAHEIDAIQLAVESKLWLEPWPYIPVGEHVQIIDGPLRGAIGVLVAHKGSNRVVLSVSLLQRSVAVEIDQEWTMPLRQAGGGWMGVRAS